MHNFLVWQVDTAEKVGSGPCLHLQAWKQSSDRHVHEFSALDQSWRSAGGNKGSLRLTPSSVPHSILNNIFLLILLRKIDIYLRVNACTSAFPLRLHGIYTYKHPSRICRGHTKVTVLGGPKKKNPVPTLRTRSWIPVKAVVPASF